MGQKFKIVDTYLMFCVDSVTECRYVYNYIPRQLNKATYKYGESIIIFQFSYIISLKIK